MQSIQDQLGSDVLLYLFELHWNTYIFLYLVNFLFWNIVFCWIPFTAIILYMLGLLQQLKCGLSWIPSIAFAFAFHCICIAFGIALVWITLTPGIFNLFFFFFFSHTNTVLSVWNTSTASIYFLCTSKMLYLFRLLHQLHYYVCLNCLHSWNVVFALILSAAKYCILYYEFHRI